MEDVQYEIKDDAIIAGRILADKPIFQEKKPKQKLFDSFRGRELIIYFIVEVGS